MVKLQIYCLRLFCAIGFIVCLIGCQDKDVAYYFKQQSHYVQGSVEEQYYLDKALALDSLHVETLVEKSVSFNKRGQYAKGMYYLNKGVELDPIEHLGYRGFVKLYMLRDYQGAINDFLRLDSLTPDFRDSPWGECINKVIGLSYMGQKKYKKALFYFNQSILEISQESGEDWVESRTFLYQGICLMKNRELNLASQSFTKLVNYCPECPSGYYYNAQALMQSQNFDINEVRILLDMAETLAQKDLIVTSPYFELPYQLYPSDIASAKQKIMKIGQRIE